MIEEHWDGIASGYCQEENKVPLGFVEGINNKIRVIQKTSLWTSRSRSTSASKESSRARMPEI